MILAVALAALLAQGGPAAASSPSSSTSSSSRKPVHGQRTVTKASVYLVQQPSFLAPRASPQPVFRGEKVKVETDAQGSWLHVSVRQGGKTVKGYLHASYVSDRPVAFKLEKKELDGRSTVSGHYNLAVGGFREEVARKRQAENAEQKRGYDLVEQYMPLQVEEKRGNRLSSRARARLLPPDMSGMRRFIEDGEMRRQERAPPAAGASGDADDAETLDKEAPAGVGEAATATGGAR